MQKFNILTATSAAFMALSAPAIAEELDVASTFGTNNLLGQMGVKFAENVSIATGGDLTLTLRSLWETERYTKLDHATIHSTLGIPQRTRYRQRARWEVIRTGGF